MEENEKNIELRKSLEDLKNEFESFKDEIIKIQETVKTEKKKLERPFEMLYLPSKGLFYKNKVDHILLGYLTYFEENLLTSELLVESGIAYEVVFSNVIYNNNICIDELLTGDVQAISLALRSFSYGNNIELDLKCSHCGYSDKESIPLSSFKMKTQSLTPDEDGEISFEIGKNRIPVKIKPITFKKELEYFKKEKKEPLESIIMFVKEFDGERDERKIANEIRTLRLLESRELRKAIDKNTPGVDTKYDFECRSCSKITKYDFGGNALDLLKLPYSYRNSVLEEIFLLTYYGKSITVDDAKKMSVTERRWFINRISEEIEKQREMEKKEIAKAKSKAKSKSF